MSGILDNKSRVIDAILTTEGKRQMAAGGFVVKFVTYSDSNVFYQKDAETSHEDPTNKIYLECFNLPHDQIIFESDDAGKLVPFNQHSFISPTITPGALTSSLSWTNFSKGKLKENTKSYGINFVTQGTYNEKPIKNDAFASQIEDILASSFDNFKKIKLIGSKDRVFEDQEFALSNNEIAFTILPDNKTVQMQNPSNVNSIDALFNDEKLRNIDNFLYLPPIKKISNSGLDKTDIPSLEAAGLFLGAYPAWGPINKLTLADIKDELSKYESAAKTIYFDPTSRDNELIAQMFEITPDSVSKLDVIDYGKVNNNSNSPFADSHHVFFIGKILIDDAGSTNFIHIFTLVFESNEENNANQAY